MIIRIGLISREKLAAATALAAELEAAVAGGHISRADELAPKLLEVAEEEGQTTLSDEAWREFNRRVRIDKSHYQANYLLPPEDCARLREKATGPEFRAFRDVLRIAVSNGSSLLQLPLAD
jgi:hypothetical protein